MRKIVLFSLVFSFLLILIGCDQDNDPPAEQKQYNYEVHPTNHDVLIGETDTLYYSSNADSLNITTPAGVITDKDPTAGTLAYAMGEEGMSEVTFDFIWNGPTIIHGTKSCFVTGHLPIKMNAADTQISWRTSASITIETFDADSLWTDIEGWNSSSTSGTIETPTLDFSQTYHAISYKNGGETGRDSVSINVDAPTRSDTISNKCGLPWTFSGLAFSPDGIIWNIADIRYCASDNTLEFSPAGQSYMRYGEIRCDTEQDVVNLWYLSPDGEYLTIGDTNIVVPFVLHIEKITMDTLEYTYHFPGFDITRETWTR